MEVSDLPRLVRNAGRLQEVVAVAVKYGIAPWLGNIRSEWIQNALRSNDGIEIGNCSQAERLRMALAELGTTYIKLGQILSTRADLVGPEIAAELSKLQAGTPADSAESVKATFEAEMGQEPDAAFANFDAVAFASASIGQVHHATLHDQSPVVVKVQHDKIEERIRNDLEIMIELARLAESNAPHLAQYRPLATATEFQHTLLDELDFTREQKNIERFARNFEEDETVRFPLTHPELCSQRILTMDRFTGISLSDRRKLEESGADLTELARRGADLFLKMVFRDGFYHADPHPGNLMALEGQVIGVLDCGMVGRVDEDLREQIEDLLLAVMDRDSQRLTDCVVDMGEVPADFDRSQLKSDLVEFVDEYAGQSLDQFDLSGALNGMTDIVRRHRIVLPSRVSLLIKMLVMLEGTSRQLSPSFSIAELLEPYRAEAVKRRLSPKRMWRKIQSAQRDWTRLAESLPRDVSEIMTRVRRGTFNVHLEHRRLDPIINRMVLGIITAALFVGSASLWSAGVRPLFYEISIPGAAGCSVACYLGFLLIRAIRKSGNI